VFPQSLRTLLMTSLFLTMGASYALAQTKADPVKEATPVETVGTAPQVEPVQQAKPPILPPPAVAELAERGVTFTAPQQAAEQQEQPVPIKTLTTQREQDRREAETTGAPTEQAVEQQTPPNPVAQAIQESQQGQPVQMAYPAGQQPPVPEELIPEAMPTPVPKTTRVAGTSSKKASPDRIPVNRNLLPVSNAGINMDLNPDLVGGYDPNLPPEQQMSMDEQIPYEIQLKQRMRELQLQARQEAFERAKNSILPLETHEIQEVLARLKDTQEAIQTPVRPAPTPGNVIRTISTDPSAKPKTIHLAAGNVTTLNIIDITGQPWPIVDIGFGGTFDVKPPEAGGHVIRITPMRDFARGNLVVRLLKMTTPLTFTLKAGGEKVDYRFDARIPEYGPNAKMPLVDDGVKLTAGDRVTTAFLEGVPPSGAQKLAVSGVEAHTSAYRFGGALYVRTPLSLLSPAWAGSATSADGMNVYVMSDAPVLLLSDKGNLVRARLSDTISR
jgi:intracellular multiplication protein IcmK